MPSVGSEPRLPRLHCGDPLAAGESRLLPPATARHVQVLRLQPGAAVTLFDGRGGEFRCVVERMGRSDVQVRVETHNRVERESRRPVHLAVGVPANERMDWLVEKATELGAASIQPLVMPRSVVRLAGERAARRQAHWHAIAIAACEQCGRNRVPPVHEPVELAAWLQSLGERGEAGQRWLLSLQPDAEAKSTGRDHEPWTILSGPEGGLAPSEEAAARAAGFRPLSLGPRVLRAETAPIAALSRWGQ